MQEVKIHKNSYLKSLFKNINRFPFFCVNSFQHKKLFPFFKNPKLKMLTCTSVEVSISQNAEKSLWWTQHISNRLHLFIIIQMLKHISTHFLTHFLSRIFFQAYSFFKKCYRSKKQKKILHFYKYSCSLLNDTLKIIELFSNILMRFLYSINICTYISGLIFP